jgi:hypothetical protein
MYSYLYLKYLENPYLAKQKPEDYNPFKKVFLSENQILLKLEEINKRLNKILKVYNTKVSDTKV